MYNKYMLTIYFDFGALNDAVLFLLNGKDYFLLQFVHNYFCGNRFCPGRIIEVVFLGI